MISLSHGGGGVETEELLERLIFSKVPDALKKVAGGLGIDLPDDAAALPMGNGDYMVVTVDAYTVDPPFFPGGDIGYLAASGSINDVVMLGGRPIAMLDSILVEEGFEERDLERIVGSMVSTLTKYGIALIGGDFKVMPKGQLDKVVITTVGIGVAKGGYIADMPRPGDVVIVTGPVGAHGAMVLSYRLGLEAKIASDAKPLVELVPILEKYKRHVHAARDPTRGGLATVLNDWAKASGTVIVVDQSSIPIGQEVRAVADMAGVDPLHLASEGVAAFAVTPEVADEFLKELKGVGFKEATKIGEVRKSERYSGYVLAKTEVGGYRILEPLRGPLVPRIC
ncbi:MAG: hydrogenase expression/formation protein HypE [Thermoproteus sp.]